MGSATSKFFADQAQADHDADERAVQASTKRRAANKRALQKARAAQRQLEVKLPQLGELISARDLWKGAAYFSGYLFSLDPWIEIDQTDTYVSLWLRMRKTIFGNTKYQVGFVETSLIGNGFFAPVNMNKWASRTLSAVDSHIAKLKFSS